MFFPNRQEFNIINEIRILRVFFLILRKILCKAITGKKMHINIYNLSNIYDISDKVICFWFKFLTTCVNIKFDKSTFHPILIDEPNKYPTLLDNEENEESNDSDENKSENTNIENKRKSIFGVILKRRSIRKSVKNIASQDIMMYTFKSKGNIHKDYQKKNFEDKKKFRIPEYKNIIFELKKNPPLNCNVFKFLKKFF